MIDGILLVDKPEGPTSHDVVRAVRRAAGQRRVGHAGTLDPAARGLLIVLLGRMTRLADAFSSADKRYEAVVRLGSATDTGDGEGAVVATADVGELDPDEVARAVEGLVGEREQVPPPYSAVKVDGRPLYRAARAGGDVPQAAPRRIAVREATLRAVDGRDVAVAFTVSKGTYIRVLAVELGDALGLPAHLAVLVRTASGPLTLHDAVPLGRLARGDGEAVKENLVDVAKTDIGIPRGSVDDRVAEMVGHGMPVSVSDIRWIDAPGQGAAGQDAPRQDVALLSAGRLIAWYEGSGPTMTARAVLAEPGRRGQ